MWKPVASSIACVVLLSFVATSGAAYDGWEPPRLICLDEDATWNWDCACEDLRGDVAHLLRQRRLLADTIQIISGDMAYPGGAGACLAAELWKAAAPAASGSLVDWFARRANAGLRAAASVLGPVGTVWLLSEAGFGSLDCLLERALSIDREGRAREDYVSLTPGGLDDVLWEFDQISALMASGENAEAVVCPPNRLLGSWVIDGAMSDQQALFDGLGTVARIDFTEEHMVIQLKPGFPNSTGTSVRATPVTYEIAGASIVVTSEAPPNVWRFFLEEDDLAHWEARVGSRMYIRRQ